MTNRPRVRSGLRPFPALFIAAIASTLAFGSIAPASATGTDAEGIGPGDPAPPAQVELTGSLTVVPAEPTPSSEVVGEAPAEPGIAFGGGAFLTTPDETRVRIDGLDLAEFTPGETLAARVEVPPEVSAAVAERVREEALELDGEATAELVAETSAVQGAALPAVEATTLEAAPGASASTRLPAAQHSVDVAFLSRQGAGAGVPDETTVNAVVSRLGAYWNRESGGQVTGVSKPAATLFRTVDWDVCADPFRTWDTAAAAFGRTSQWYWQNTSQRHLLVLVDQADPSAACDGSGIGSVGANARAGGTMHAEVPVAEPRDWDGVVFHEFGHNLSLGHSNSRLCTSPHIDSGTDPYTDGCVDEEYADRYDVMGGGTRLVDRQGNVLLSNNRDIASLNVTHRAQLDSLGSSLVRVDLQSSDPQVLAIRSAGSGSGTRGIEVADPTTGERLFVEYRGTTGADANAMYSRWASISGDPPGEGRYGNGVRVLRTPSPPTPSNNPSVLLQRWSGQGRVAYLRPGDRLSGYTDAIHVRVLSADGDTATVEIGSSPYTARPTPSVSVKGGGEAWVGKTLTVSGAGPGAWEPRPAEVSYQWFRDGSPIPGAEGVDYTLSGADTGRGITVQATPWRDGRAGAPAASAPLTPGGPAVGRISGATRFETAVEVSKRAFPGRAPVIYLATGSNFPDALAAAPAAATLGGPLLLVPGSAAQVPQSLLDRVAQLQPSRIVVVGGTAAIPEGVVERISAAAPGGVRVDRIAGGDRFDTGNALVEDAFAGRGASRVFIATGNDFPDALSASAVAGAEQNPVVLVSGTAPLLDAATARLLQRLDPSRVTIVGGTSAVSPGIERQLAEHYTTERLAGSDRFATSVAVNRAGFTGTIAKHYWATGSGFADALSGAVLAAVDGAPLYVIPAHCAPRPVLADVGAQRVSSVTLIGGTSALQPSVETLVGCG